MAAGETVLVNTVDYNISKYSEREYTRAILAQKLQQKIALPSHRYLVKVVVGSLASALCPLQLLLDTYG